MVSCLVIIIAVLLSQIAFQSDKDELDALAIFGDLAHPFGLDVFQGIFRIDLNIAPVIYCPRVESKPRFQKPTLKQSMMVWVSS